VAASEVLGSRFDAITEGRDLPDLVSASRLLCHPDARPRREAAPRDILPNFEREE
jgi:hypothetical protein